MGSIGSGNFSDYSSYKGNSNQGGSSGEDKCGKGFDAELEDVAICDYSKLNNNVPPIDSQVEVVFIKPRLAVVDSKKVCIGYLPTQYNYLRACLTDGFTYSGIVGHSSLTPIPNVSVLISPAK